jgi:peptidylprolyl isomerase
VTQLHRAAAAVLALALTAAACGSTAKKEEPTDLRQQIKITGDFGAKPVIDITTPLELEESSSWVAEAGQGDKVGEESTAIVQLTMADGRTGKTVISTFDQGQRPLEAKLGDQIFPSLAQALAGKPAASRLVVASTAEDAYGKDGAPQLGLEAGDPVVMVADILSTDPTSVLDGPSGPSTTPPATAPRLLEEDSRPVGFDFAGARKPKKLVVVPLREGTGPEVVAPDRIAADYLGQVWGAAKPFQETFTKEPAGFSVGLSLVIKAWDRALVGQKEGARVMIISPPADAYAGAAQPGIPANSTLVFVVDVLGVG